MTHADVKVGSPEVGYSAGDHIRDWWTGIRAAAIMDRGGRRGANLPARARLTWPILEWELRAQYAGAPPARPGWLVVQATTWSTFAPGAVAASQGAAAGIGHAIPPPGGRWALSGFAEALPEATLRKLLGAEADARRILEAAGGGRGHIARTVRPNGRIDVVATDHGMYALALCTRWPLPALLETIGARIHADASDRYATIRDELDRLCARGPIPTAKADAALRRLARAATRRRYP